MRMPWQVAQFAANSASPFLISSGGKVCAAALAPDEREAEADQLR